MSEVSALICCRLMDVFDDRFLYCDGKPDDTLRALNENNLNRGGHRGLPREDRGLSAHLCVNLCALRG